MSDKPVTLYDYYRSTAAYRVRIALAYKDISYASSEVHMLKNGGQQHSAAYKALNPQALVPTLEAEGAYLTQSLAILEYLEETHPEPALLPREPLARAKVRAFALSIACDLHPVNNLRILQYLTGPLEHDKETKITWYHHWLSVGLGALEEMAQRTSGGQFCYGNTVTLADVCLIPQMYNARRFEFPLEKYSHLQAIDKHCCSLPFFIAASPEKA